MILGTNSDRKLFQSPLGVVMNIYFLRTAVVLFFAFSLANADLELDQYVQKFNKYVVSKGQKLLSFYDYKAEEALQKSKPKTSAKIIAKKEQIKLALDPFVTPETANDNYEIVFNDPVLKKRVLKNLGLKEEDTIHFGQVKNVKKLDLSGDLKNWQNHKGEQIYDITPLKFFTSLEDLNLDVNEISDISPLSKLKKISVLKMFRNKVKDLTPLANMKNLTFLKMYLNKIHDITPISGLTSLKNIDFSANQIESLKPLENLEKLEVIEFFSNKIEDISYLRKLTKLKDINLGNNKITDVTAFKNMPHLEDLWLNFNSEIKNIEELKHCSKKIHTMGVSGCNVNDLSFISDFTNLNYLIAERNNITELKPISHFSKLKSLCISENSISDITPLREMAKNGCFKGFPKFKYAIDITRNKMDLSAGSANRNVLDELAKTIKKLNWKDGNLGTVIASPQERHNHLGETNLENNTEIIINDPDKGFQQGINLADNSEIVIADPVLKKRILKELGFQDQDIIRLKDVKDIRKLDLSGDIKERFKHDGEQIYDISALKFFTALEVLNLEVNEITDITPLSHLKNLRHLEMDNNNVKDLTPISKLTSLKKINFYINKVESLEPLKNLVGLEGINFWANKIEDASCLAKLTKLKYINLGCNKLSDVTVFTSMPNLKTLWLNNCRDIKNIEKIKDYSKSINTLTINKCNVKDLSFVSGFNNLRYFSAEDNKITDIKPLMQLSRLQTLLLGDNLISDLEPLKKMLETGYFKRHTNIDITGNNLKLTPGSINRAIVDELDKAIMNLKWKDGNQL